MYIYRATATIAARPNRAPAPAVRREPPAFASVEAEGEAPADNDEAAGFPEAAEVLEASAPDACAADDDGAAEVAACEALLAADEAAAAAELGLLVAAALELAGALEAADCGISASSSTILTPHLAWKSKSAKGSFHARQLICALSAASAVPSSVSYTLKRFSFGNLGWGNVPYAT